MLDGCSFLIRLAKSETGSSEIVIRSILVLLDSLLLLINCVRNAFERKVSDGRVAFSNFCSFNYKLPLLSKPAETPLVVLSFFTDVCAFNLVFDWLLIFELPKDATGLGRDGFFSKSGGCFGGSSALLPDGCLQWPFWLFYLERDLPSKVLSWFSSDLSFWSSYRYPSPSKLVVTFYYSSLWILTDELEFIVWDYCGFWLRLGCCCWGLKTVCLKVSPKLLDSCIRLSWSY